MPLNYYGNEPEKAPEPGPKMSSDDLNAMLNGEKDVNDDDTVRELIGDDGLKSVLKVEQFYKEAAVGMAQVMLKKAKGDESFKVGLFFLTMKMKAAVEEFTKEEITSLLAMGLNAEARTLLSELNEMDDDDDDED